MFNNKIIVVTGGANGIGKCITEEFSYALAVGGSAPFYLTKLMVYHGDHGWILED